VPETNDTSLNDRHLNLIVHQDDHGERLDRYISRLFPEYSRSYFQRLIKKGHVLVEGHTARSGDVLSAGSHIDIVIPHTEPQTIGPEDIGISIIYEDENLAVVDKQAGLSVHPGAGRISGTLVSALLFRGMPLSEKAGPERPGIVHRLDKDTSGLIVVAKDDRAYDGLKTQFSAHTVSRLYRGICWGKITSEQGTIDTLIARHGRDRTRMTTRTGVGRQAITEYRVIERFSAMTYAQFRLKTGRTHQIRVHMASRGHPIVGDRTYGSARAARGVTDRNLLDALSALTRQALHASCLGFIHPETGKTMEFESELPADIARLLGALCDDVSHHHI
jgi:23S rRNA pseudouridine1911/1915/1917 synthase